VFDAVTGHVSIYRAGETMTEASIMKVDILEVLLAHTQAIGLSLSEDQRELCRSMIEESDNDAAQSLWDSLGGAAAVARYNSAAGVTRTRPNEAGYWGLSTTSALDQVRLVEKISYANSLLTGRSRMYALDLMSHVDPTQSWGVSAGVPSGVVVALKDGWYPIDGVWQVNSVGYIRGEGRDYVIAVLVGHETTEAAGIRTIDGLSTLIWAQLAPASSWIDNLRQRVPS
jgi:beta-lactamase class A